MAAFSIRLSFALAAALLLAACTQLTPRPATEVAPAEAPCQTQAEARVEPLPKQELTGQILYQALLAEIAGQRGALGTTAMAYLDLAIATRDPRFARRAAAVAFQARGLDTALKAAHLWVDIDPESLQARQMLAGLLAGTNRIDELRLHVAKLLSQKGGNLCDGLLRLNQLFALHPDKKVAQALIEELTMPYVGIAETHYARAHAALNAGAWQRGVEDTDKALALRPGWERAVLLKAQLQRPESADAALQTLSAYLAAHPKAREVRLQYARGLVGEHKYPEARAEFQHMLNDFSGNTDIVYAVAVLSMQLNDLGTAEENFKKLLESEFAEINTVYLYLGHIAEERKHSDAALVWYGQITSGEQYLAARIRSAQLLAKQGRLEDGRKRLREIQVTAGDRLQLLLAEAQLLRGAGQAAAAFELIDGVLAVQGEQPELLYESALLAEKIGRLDVLESRLRKVIQLKPDHAYAYNALGYSFTERNEHLEEAQQLITKALQLAPEDPFILDSMGWVLFRKGDGPGALNYLQRAFAIRDDPEIAAHLGEVLWALSRRDEAKKTWQEAQQANPGNEALAEVIRRFNL